MNEEKYEYNAKNMNKYLYGALSKATPMTALNEVKNQSVLLPQISNEEGGLCHYLLVGPDHIIESVIPQTVVNDQFEYENKEITDDEFHKLRVNRNQWGQSDSKSTVDDK